LTGTSVAILGPTAILAVTAVGLWKAWFLRPLPILIHIVALLGAVLGYYVSSMPSNSVGAPPLKSLLLVAAPGLLVYALYGFIKRLPNAPPNASAT
jgi:hypothetical protein